MKLQKIDNPGDYSNLVGNFSFKETITNNYMLPSEVAKLIAEGRMKEWHDEEKCFLFVKKAGGVYRMYYSINDSSNPAPIITDFPVITEILFRGNAGEPTKEITFLKSCGFIMNLRRDQLATSIPNVVECEPTFAQSPEDALKAIYLFNSTFDRYSGDYIEPTLAESLYEKKSLLCAYDKSGNFQGSLEANFTGRNAWVSHLVVGKDFRGQGVADKLMSMFITYAWKKECKRLMLWVQHQNGAALSLYGKYGFKYANKSTISLIKE